MSTSDHLSGKPHKAAELFACSLYVLRKRSAMSMTCTGGFPRKSRHSLITSPTKDAMQQAVRYAHYQAMIWNNDNVANQTIPYPESYDWKKDRDSQWLQMWYFIRWKQDVQASVAPLSEVNRHVWMRWVKTVWARMWSAMMTVMMETSFRWGGGPQCHWWRPHIFIKRYCKIIRELLLYYLMVCYVLFVVSLLAYPSIKFVKEWRQ